MKAGQEVVCISNEGFWYQPYPKVGEICLIINSRSAFGRLYFRLKGYDYTIGYGPGKIVVFYAGNFVPLDSINREESITKQCDLQTHHP